MAKILQSVHGPPPKGLPTPETAVSRKGRNGRRAPQARVEDQVGMEEGRIGRDW